MTEPDHPPTVTVPGRWCTVHDLPLDEFDTHCPGVRPRDCSVAQLRVAVDGEPEPTVTLTVELPESLVRKAAWDGDDAQHIADAAAGPALEWVAANPVTSPAPEPVDRTIVKVGDVWEDPEDGERIEIVTGGSWPVVGAKVVLSSNPGRPVGWEWQRLSVVDLLDAWRLVERDGVPVPSDTATGDEQ